MICKRILFIPADSLPFGLTRSYWIAKELSKYHEIYLLRWSDPRTRGLDKAKSCKFSSPIAFFVSLFTPIKIINKLRNKEENFKIVKAPVMLNAAIKYVLGEINARKICRLFNRAMLYFLIKIISPNAIFYGDGFYYFPAIKRKGIQIYADMQDDFDENNMKISRYEVPYASKCFSKCKQAYAASPGVVKRLSDLYEVRFKWLPNGADFRRFQIINEKELEELKLKLKLNNRLILSYIGSSAHLDKDFIVKLSYKLRLELPEAIILLVGTKGIEMENIISVGFIDPNDIHFYFLISDIGLFPAPNPRSNFILHSQPLKIVQYSAAKKPLISVPIKWIEENKFPNVSTLPLDVDIWIKELKKLRYFRWKQEWDDLWKKYDWGVIGNMLEEEIRKEDIL